MTSKHLLTGATGFLGAHIGIALLKQGYSVKALCRKGSTKDEFLNIMKMRGENLNLLNNLTWVECDILDTVSLLQAMQGVEQVYHCAAVVSFWKNRTQEMMLANAQGTANIVNCALAAGVKKLCYASSIAALGREKRGDTIDENTHWTNSPYNTQYAISKYLAEMEVWRGIEEGLPAVIVNPGVILGEGRWDKGSCRLFTTAAKGFPFYTTGYNGYVDVQDVAKAMVLLMESPITAERFVMVGENLEFKDLFTRMAKYFGKPAPSIRVGAFLAQVARLLYGFKSLIDGKEPLVTKETARNSRHSFIYNGTKITNVIPFTYTPIDQTIERTCRACKGSL